MTMPEGTGTGTAGEIRTAELPEDFDLDHGNAVRDLFATRDAGIRHPGAAPMDAPIVVRLTHLVQTAWFDAIAPYHPTAVGVYSRLGRRPAAERATNRERNIAILYAAHRLYTALLPEAGTAVRQVLTALGLDPDDGQENTETPAGIGNLAGRGVLEARLRDGMNQTGDEGGRRYHPMPYADYLGYRPVNTAYEISDPSRWQPALGPHLRRLGDGPADLGAFLVQQFAVVQWGVTRPYAIGDPGQYRVPPPRDSDHRRAGPYRRQTEEVLALSAALTDEQKLMAEVFDNKFLGIGRPVFAAAENHGLDLDGWVHLCMCASTAVFDAGIVVWQEKRRYDAVRPFTAVRHLYGDRPVTAWGGPGEGTVTDMPGSEWTGYLKVADHPEYPSASATLCAAQSRAARLFLGSDALGFGYTVAPGGSLVEPGVVPARELELRWDTWSGISRDCGMSRLWGGVHFRAAVEAGWELGPRIGDAAHDFVRRHLDGRAADS
ncbi:vanadium-dependent haloperoxidase [Streptomyces aidingensis]|uniref:PAP2 superfamily protein n=1 Tax=Streptomyces aidingensis TaxID=910347 RepID=A0A1I1QJB2_9ACTN|nr:vanadium-dependent haloperoxidase [Streptomyces aidingensis]SFD19353.1 hypothetical protein SAMN05421773_1112 [Streptomyces aidingensis]